VRPGGCLRVELSLLERVSPIEWDNVIRDNVILCGRYVLNRRAIQRRRAAA
jgi:hypothetical protein